jgi:hypothetical protein
MLPLGESAATDDNDDDADGCDADGDNDDHGDHGDDEEEENLAAADASACSRREDSAEPVHLATTRRGDIANARCIVLINDTGGEVRQ